jgi:hypothetical protein
MQTAAEDHAYGLANMTASKQLQFQNSLSDVKTEATTWSMTETARVAIQLEREIYGYT